MKSRLIAKATLLLTTRLNDSIDSPRPLSLSEYHQFAAWLDAKGLTFADMLDGDAGDFLRPHPAAERIRNLLERSCDVDSLLAHWQRMGIWVIGERQPGFPTRLRRRLKTACLPLLFGAGPMDALDRGGLCVVGSRDCTAEASRFAETVGERAGKQGVVVISSDMRGVDRGVISATLAAGGSVIGVLSDSLEKAAASRRYRTALAAGRATLITPFAPDIRFAVANAMRANRYQYGLSDAAIVVETRQSGGIWSGAEENRKQRWVPAFVRAGENVCPGNSALLHLGLVPITQREIENSADLAALLVTRASSPPAPKSQGSPRPDLYSIFLAELARLDRSISGSEESVARHFGIELPQARAWLARATHENA
ncbi:MAG: DNA-protecting protein DprA [Betaproteobacteria bacterium]|nr:DNA-protecting protein DprA [Betaproteobacteria bacterium]